MRWKGRRQSTNVEDRRGRRAAPRIAVGGGAGVLVLALLVWILGGNPMQVLQSPGTGVGAGPAPGAQVNPAEEELASFVRVVLADTEDAWHRLMPALGREYEEPTLVLFSGAVDSACGFADAAVGPFYCDRGGKVYIDLSFYDQLKRNFGAPGDFAQAYVVAHEVGHHVQHLLGVSQEVHASRARMNESDFNRLSVRLELQADYFAGVWAHHAQRTKNILEPGDLEEALRAAAAIGDDTIQRRAQGYVVPDSFTHGSSEQRVRWFRRGYETGDPARFNPFEVPWDEL